MGDRFVVFPIKTKNGEDVHEGAKEVLRKMGTKQKKCFTDDERAIAGEDVKEYVEGKGIDLYQTRGHPAFAERLSGLLRINFVKELRQMKRKERTIYNGQTT